MKMLAAMLVFVLATGCSQREVKLTLGDVGEGLDGFVCKDDKGQYLLERLVLPDGGTQQACLVTDFVDLQGVPGCRTGQLVAWCATHDCKPIPSTRVTTPITLPTGVAGMTRRQARDLVHTQFKKLSDTPFTSDAPPQFVMARMMATAQPCSEIATKPDGTLPKFEASKLVGCAYSCPTLFDQIQQDVYLGFDTLENDCAHGVATCADNALKWAP